MPLVKSDGARAKLGMEVETHITLEVSFLPSEVEEVEEVEVEADTILVTSSQLLVDQSTLQVLPESPASIRPLDSLVPAQVATSLNVFRCVCISAHSFVSLSLSLSFTVLNKASSKWISFSEDNSLNKAPGFRSRRRSTNEHRLSGGQE